MPLRTAGSGQPGRCPAQVIPAGRRTSQGLTTAERHA